MAPWARGSLEYYGIEDTINDDLTVRNVITLGFKEPINHLNYQLNFEIFNLETESSFDSADCSITDGNTISCDFEGVTLEENQLKLSFDTAGGVRKTDGKFEFNVNYGFIPTDNAFILIRLPPTAVLSEEIVNKSFSPQDGGILTDGKRIMVFWEMENVSQENIQFSVSYVLPPEVPSLVIITLTAIVIIVMVGVIVFARKRQHGVEMLSTVLTSDEKVIVDILKREGKALQKVLVRESDFSKAKVSRIVKDMKERGIIEIEPVSGRENRIILSVGKKTQDKNKSSETPTKGEQS